MVNLISLNTSNNVEILLTEWLNKSILLRKTHLAGMENETKL